VGSDVYYTDDGGSHWIRLSRTPPGNALRQRHMSIAPTYAVNNPALWFIDSKNGLMARLDGEIYRTNDGGRTWELAWEVDKNITDLFFINDRDGWIVGNEGFVARTIDGGLTWSAITTPVRADLTNVFFISKQIGCAVGYESTILYTRDGGATWNQASIDGKLNALPLASVAFSDEKHGWVVGGAADPMSPSLSVPSNVVLATDDGGQSWRLMKL
jgi:photosystem II stability/assembly factor-like uncharacterized protein